MEDYNKCELIGGGSTRHLRTRGLFVVVEMKWKLSLFITTKILFMHIIC